MQVIEQSQLNTAAGRPIALKWFGQVPYQTSYEAMRTYASQRNAEEGDQIWLLEHPQVYTQGTACDLDTFIPSDIPVVKTDRGGQITFHGPGQIVLYPLLNLKNNALGVKSLVNHLEQCVIDLLTDMNIESARKPDAPGVYVNGAKIAALGLRIRKGNTYHGLSFNVDMDVSPFNNIDPCGYQGLRVEQLSAFDVYDKEVHTPREIGKRLAKQFVALI